MGKLIPSLLLGSALGIAACGPPYPLPRRNVPTAARSDRPAPVEIANAKREQHSQRKETRVTR
jgi:hypothetical protein